MRLWIFLKKNFDIILIIAGAMAVGILEFFQQVGQDIVSGAILAILSLIAISLLVNRTTDAELKQTTEKILERLQKPSVDQTLVPYGEWMDEISQGLLSAKEVWILSRTCMRIWEDYYDQLMRVLVDNDGSVRLILVDPDDGALKMIANTAIWHCPNDPAMLRAHVIEFIKLMFDLCSRLEQGSLEVRTIDYLPAWTLVLINPSSDKPTAFVELSTFHANGRNRPTFWLIPERDKRLFWMFQNEFETMWRRARSIEDVVNTQRDT